MNTRKIVALVVSVLMVLGSFATVSAAAFPDITSSYSWAEEAIDDMASRGILKGYTNGTFRPANPVSHLETLIIAARIMGVDNEESADFKDAAVEAYSDIVSEYESNFAAEVAYLLYWGVIDEDDLELYLSESNKNTPLKRYEAATIVTKLVGGDIDALGSSFVLDFADSSAIPSSAKAYVKYVSDAGLMNGVGDNNFDPSGELTRAMIATMMYRAEDYMDASAIYGTVQNVGSSSISVLVDGNTKNISVSSSTRYALDGKEVALSDISVGTTARVNYQDSDVRFVEAVSSSSNATVSGTIQSVSDVNGSRKISLSTVSGTVTYPVNIGNCSYMINNSYGTFTDLTTNMYVTLTIREGYVSEVKAQSGTKTYKGTVKDVLINNNSAGITIIDKDDVSLDFVILDNVTVSRNSKSSDIRSICVGDSVSLTVINGAVTKIVATSDSSSTSGTITKIVIAPNSTVTVKVGADELTYGVTSETAFTVDGVSGCTIYDLRLGATAQLRLDSTNISSISTTSTVAAPTISGVISYVHPTSYVMGLTVVDPLTGAASEVQTVVKSNVKVTDTTSSRISTFKALKPGMTVVVVGASNYGVYEVSQIIVTAQ